MQCHMPMMTGCPTMADVGQRAGRRAHVQFNSNSIYGLFFAISARETCCCIVGRLCRCRRGLTDCGLLCGDCIDGFPWRRPLCVYIAGLCAYYIFVLVPSQNQSSSIRSAPGWTHIITWLYGFAVSRYYMLCRIARGFGRQNHIYPTPSQRSDIFNKRQ